MIELFINFIKLNWFGIVTFILGISVSYIFFKISLNEAVPIYIDKTIKLIGKDNSLIPNEVTILFKGHEIEQLSKSIIIFWNKGKKTIYGNDIVKDDKLQLSFNDDVEILSTDIINKTKEANKFTVKLISKNEISISFDYLDVNDGATIEILHTGYNIKPSIKGTIMGIPKGVIKYNKNKSFFGIEINKVFEYLSVISICTTIVFTVDFVSSFRTFTTNKLFILISSILILICMFYITNKKPFPKSLKVENIDI